MMSSRRDWQLQEMGITRYQLRRPYVLQGENTPHLPDDLRFLMISDDADVIKAQFTRDLLQTLKISAENMVCITPLQWERLKNKPHCVCWSLVSDVNSDEYSPLLITPRLNDLMSDGQAKRALWQQICDHASYFFPQS